LIESEFQEEVLTLFAREASGWIGQIKASLWELELGPPPERARALYAALQRDLSTLKGSAGTVNLPSAEELVSALLPLLPLQPGREKASLTEDTVIRASVEVLASIIKVLNMAPHKTVAVDEIENLARQQVQKLAVRTVLSNSVAAARAAGPPIMAVENLRKVYREGRVEVVAVNGVTLSLQAGEMVAVVGPSGSGKTTLLSMMGFLLVPTSGTIRLLGRPVETKQESMLPALRRKHIGFIFQNANLLRALTALENVMVALRLKGLSRGQARQEAERLLGRVGLGHRKHFRPRDLSGGEKQRVAIARALAGGPSLILADEPTASLDSKSGHAVVELMREITNEGGHAVAMVTHDTRNLNIVDRLVQLEDGRVVG
jgi:putative ABC transport system ATP-binding protein